MLFNSLSFAIFLPIVFALYWLLPHKYRWVLLLIASYYFYMSWNVKYVTLILTTTLISYAAARLLEGQPDLRKKKWILAGAAAVSLGILFFFKYFNFFSESLAAFFGLFAIPMNPILLKLLLPVGISFYTFQTLSYVIDVYRGTIPAERHLGYYATFISFFPQLVAGPIERTTNLLPQIKAKHTFNYDQATYGLKLMTWGFFQKIVIADTLSTYVSSVFDAPRNYEGFSLVLAVLMFTVQIYCDFSGYSDIAIGTAKMLGIDLMTNFRSPYFAQSIKEFWSRWHISLSTWFRDYVYIPLGGNRVGKVRQAFNLILTFLVSGLWHGANWTFVIWGGIHGCAQVLERFLSRKTKNLRSNPMAILKTLGVFIFIAFTWIFFVSKSLNDALYVIGHLFTGIGSPLAYLQEGFYAFSFSKSKLLSILFFIFMLAVYDGFSLKTDCIQWISSQNKLVRNLAYWGLVLIIVFFRATVEAEFVYFQF